jgi:rare lipoprotein A
MIMKCIGKLILLLGFVVVLYSCGKQNFATNNSSGFSGKKTDSQTGNASYYADKFNGRSTANGERFNNNAFTAAHRKLPFGTQVKVTNLSNGKTVMVRVNDRGPFAGNRIIDLSKAAAQQIDMVRAGVAKVKIEYVVK